MNLDLVQAERALKLACELDEVAKSAPVQVDALLSLIEPPARRLRTLKDGKRTEPAEAAAFLRKLEDVLDENTCLQDALEKLIPSREERERIKACRAEMCEFYERVAEIPETKRAELADDLKIELTEIYSRWPVSTFAQELLNDSIDDLFRGALNSAWLVPVPEDDAHAGMREQLRRAFRVSADAVSPLLVWQLCPAACADCWYSLKDRMRRAIHRLAEKSDDRVARSQHLVETRGEVRMHGKDVAQRLGVSASQFSRWRNQSVVPAWAQSEPERFQRLILVGRKEKVPVSHVDELEDMLREWTETELKTARKGTAG